MSVVEIEKLVEQQHHILCTARNHPERPCSCGAEQRLDVPGERPAVVVEPKYLEAAEIVRFGWCQHHSCTRVKGRIHHCLMGALGMVFLNTAAGIDGLGFDRAEEAVAWNDDPRRTQAQVVERLERAAYGL